MKGAYLLAVFAIIFMLQMIAILAALNLVIVNLAGITGNAVIEKGADNNLAGIYKAALTKNCVNQTACDRTDDIREAVELAEKNGMDIKIIPFIRDLVG